MKIARVRAFRPPRPNPTFNQADLLVVVDTDSGLQGVGEGGSREMLAQCAGGLIGADPRRVAHLWQTLYRGWFYPAGREKLHALGALDLALWDILGKSLNTPVYQLLGGLARDHVECYSTGYPWQGSLEATAAACRAAGFRAYRTATADCPAGQPFDARAAVRQTVRACAEIREGVGPEGDWCIDYHARLDLPDAVRLSQRLTELEPLFIEDPLRSELAGALPEFRAQTGLPVAVGEQYGDRWDIVRLIESNTVNYTRVTLPNVGGITEFCKIAALCETHGLGMIPHFTGPVAVAALAHVLSTLPVPVLQEVGGSGPKLPGYLTAGFDFHNGNLWPVDRPGLGVEFDASSLELILEVSEPCTPIPLYHRPDGSYTNW